MIQDLVKNLTTQLGVNQNQAEGGLGLIFKLAQEKLNTQDFDSITKVFGSLDSFIQKAPASTGTGTAGGMGNLIGNIAAAVGLNNLGTVGQLASGFKALNIDTATMSKFLPLVLDFVQQKGGDQVKTVLESLIQKK